MRRDRTPVNKFEPTCIVSPHNLIIFITNLYISDSIIPKIFFYFLFLEMFYRLRLGKLHFDDALLEALDRSRAGWPRWTRALLTH